MEKQRTTININQKVLLKAKHEAVNRGVSLGELITVALTHALVRGSKDQGTTYNKTYVQSKAGILADKINKKYSIKEENLLAKKAKTSIYEK